MSQDRPDYLQKQTMPKVPWLHTTVFFLTHAKCAVGPADFPRQLPPTCWLNTAGYFSLMAPHVNMRLQGSNAILRHFYFTLFAKGGL